MKNKKTNQLFWDWYLNKNEKKNELDQNNYFESNMIHYLDNQIDFNSINSVFEIGCCPGRFLKYFSSKNLMINGIDYSEKSYLQMINDFEFNKIQYNNIILQDFLRFHPTEKYDLVCSFGFIEHFKDVDTIISKHLKLLNKNGNLIIGIPNFTGLTGFFQRKVGRSVLEAHELDIMKKSFFKKIASDYSLTISDISYLGGFDKDMIARIKEKKFQNIFFRVVLKLIEFSRLHLILRNLKNKYFSSYIIASFKNIQ